MTIPNAHYKELKDSYLFYNIAQKTGAYMKEHPNAHLLRLGIGDVTLPLCGAVIKALHEAVEDQAKKETFHGYYAGRNVLLDEEEIFVSSGASDELGDILDLFDQQNTVLVMEPAYPAYVDANIIAGHKLIHFPSEKENGFVPLPDSRIHADILYICSPNNPTGNVFPAIEIERLITAFDGIVVVD